MGKSSFFTGQPVFNQLLNLIPRATIDRLSRVHGANRYCKRFMAYDHLVSMLYAGYHQCTSLRELTTGLQANASKLSHLGLKTAPRRSTISDANKRRPADFFADLYHELYSTYFSPDSRSMKKEDSLYIIDSTTIALFTDIMKAAGCKKADGKSKGGAKAHVLLDAENDVPAYVLITESKDNDQVFLKVAQVPAGTTVVMDRAYCNYQHFNQWTQRDIKWVNRQRSVAHVRITASRPLTASSQQQGVLCDELVTLGTPGRTANPVVPARRVQYFDSQKDRKFYFITNDLDKEPEVIADIYRRRWQVELLFKRIKQRYPLRNFLGDNPNAIKIQIWAALLCDLLIKIVQNQVNKLKKRPWAYTSISAMIKHHLMNYISLKEFLLDPEKMMRNYVHPVDQIELFGNSGAYS